LDGSLRDIIGFKNKDASSKLFGAKPILLGGDFKQFLPIIIKGKRQEIVQAATNRSYMWDSCQVSRLLKSMRVSNIGLDGNVYARMQAFNDWILAMRDGKLLAIAKESEEEPAWIKIPAEFLI